MKYVAGAALLGVGALIVGVAFVALRPDSPTKQKPDALRAAAASLKDGYAITMTPANPATPTRVSRLEALMTATREARFLGGEREDAHLVYYTDRYYGKHRDSGPVVPFYNDHLSWLVLFRHGTEVLVGPPGGGSNLVPAPVGVAAFVDAKSGALITVVTIDDLP